VSQWGAIPARVRPLFHPSIDDVTVEGILHALSDPVRAHIFVEIAGADHSQTCSAFLEVTDRTVPKSTLSQHFKVLRDAGLIRSQRQGIEMHNTPRCDELEHRFPGLVKAIIDAHKSQTERQRARRRRRARSA